MAARFILAISTSSGVAKVAVAEECLPCPHIVFNFEIRDYKSQSAQLLPTLQQQLQASGLDAKRCAAIAVDVGPGGFTSLRTACGIAQGLAMAWEVPTVPLSSFECMLPDTEQNKELTLLIDARLEEVYAAKIQRMDNTTYWLDRPYLLGVKHLHSLEGPLVCDSHVFELLGSVNTHAAQGEVLATRLAQLAWQEFNAGRISAPFDCQPLYVRDKVAQTTHERLALKHGSI